MRLASGGRIITKKTVHAVDRLHREAKLLLPRIAMTAIGYSLSIQDPIKFRTHNTIPVGDGITDFIL